MSIYVGYTEAYYIHSKHHSVVGYELLLLIDNTEEAVWHGSGQISDQHEYIMDNATTLSSSGKTDEDIHLLDNPPHMNRCHVVLFAGQV